MAVHTAGNTHIGANHTAEYEPEVTDADGNTSVQELTGNSFEEDAVIAVKHTVEAATCDRYITVYYYKYNAGTLRFEGTDYTYGPQTYAIPAVYTSESDLKLTEKISINEGILDLNIYASTPADGEWVSLRVDLSRNLVKGETVWVALESEWLATRFDNGFTDMYRAAGFVSFPDYENALPVSVLPKGFTKRYITDSFYFTYKDTPDPKQYMRKVSGATLLRSVSTENICFLRKETGKAEGTNPQGGTVRHAGFMRKGGGTGGTGGDAGRRILFLRVPAAAGGLSELVTKSRTMRRTYTGDVSGGAEMLRRRDAVRKVLTDGKAEGTSERYKAAARTAAAAILSAGHPAIRRCLYRAAAACMAFFSRLTAMKPDHQHEIRLFGPVTPELNLEGRI
jgi:hypothetical protein